MGMNKLRQVIYSLAGVLLIHSGTAQAQILFQPTFDSQTPSTSRTVAARQEEPVFVGIMGEIAQPGVYQAATGDLKLNQIVQKLGGLTADASGNVRIIRYGRAGQQTFYSPTNQFALMPGDLIIVDSQKSSGTHRQFGTPSANTQSEAAQIGVVGLIDRPVVLKVRSQHANLPAMLSLLGQSAELAEDTKVIEPPAAGLRRETSDERQLPTGTVLVLDPLSVRPTGIPDLPAVHTLQAAVVQTPTEVGAPETNKQDESQHAPWSPDAAAMARTVSPLLSAPGRLASRPNENADSSTTVPPLAQGPAKTPKRLTQVAPPPPEQTGDSADEPLPFAVSDQPDSPQPESPPAALAEEKTSAPSTATPDSDEKLAEKTAQTETKTAAAPVTAPKTTVPPAPVPQDVATNEKPDYRLVETGYGPSNETADLGWQYAPLALVGLAAIILTISWLQSQVGPLLISQAAKATVPTPTVTAQSSAKPAVALPERRIDTPAVQSTAESERTDRSLQLLEALIHNAVEIQESPPQLPTGIEIFGKTSGNLYYRIDARSEVPAPHLDLVAEISTAPQQQLDGSSTATLTTDSKSYRVDIGHQTEEESTPAADVRQPSQPPTEKRETQSAHSAEDGQPESVLERVLMSIRGRSQQ